MTNYEAHLKEWERELIRRREVAYLMAATLPGTTDQGEYCPWTFKPAAKANGRK